MARLTRWGVNGRGEAVVPWHLRRPFAVRNRRQRRELLDRDAADLIATAPAPLAAGPDPDEWDEAAFLETYERPSDLVEGGEYDDDVQLDDAMPVQLRKAARPDFHRFAAALRSKPIDPGKAHAVALETAKQEPHVGRHHTNGCYGARYDLRKKGLLVDCSQCDRALTQAEASACRSPFCKAAKPAIAQRAGFR